MIKNDGGSHGINPNKLKLPSGKNLNSEEMLNFDKIKKEVNLKLISRTAD